MCEREGEGEGDAEAARGLGITPAMIEAVMRHLQREHRWSDRLLADAGEWDVRGMLIAALGAKQPGEALHLDE